MVRGDSGSRAGSARCSAWGRWDRWATGNSWSCTRRGTMRSRSWLCDLGGAPWPDGAGRLPPHSPRPRGCRRCVSGNLPDPGPEGAAVHVTDSLGRWLHGVSRRVALAGEGRIDAPSRRNSRWRLEQARRRRLGLRARHGASYSRRSTRKSTGCRRNIARRWCCAISAECRTRRRHVSSAVRVGTIESRLSRGRGLLRTRLIRRGLTPAALGFILAARSSAAESRPGSAQATLRAAIQLAAGKHDTRRTGVGFGPNLVKGAQGAMLDVSAQDRRRIPDRRERSGSRRRRPGRPGAERSRRPPPSEWIVLFPARRSRKRDRPESRVILPRLPHSSSGSVRWSSGSMSCRRLTVRAPATDELRWPIPIHGSTPTPSARFDRDSNAWSRRFTLNPDRRSTKGDPLAELFSIELASAKNELLAKTIQANLWKRLFELRQKLAQTGAISQQLWVDTQSEQEGAATS